MTKLSTSQIFAGLAGLSAAVLPQLTTYMLEVEQLRMIHWAAIVVSAIGGFSAGIYSPAPKQ